MRGACPRHEYPICVPTLWWYGGSATSGRGREGGPAAAEDECSSHAGGCALGSKKQNEREKAHPISSEMGSPIPKRRKADVSGFVGIYCWQGVGTHGLSTTVVVAA